MSSLAAWAGVIVTDLATAASWYADVTGARIGEAGERWTSLRFGEGSCIELHEGDPTRPGLTFPSYGGDPGPAVMPGFAVDDEDARSDGLVVARSLPGWIVVVAPGGLRVVLADHESAAGEGLVGFAFSAPAPEELEAFLDRIGSAGAVERSPELRVVPLVAGAADEELTDPDGNLVRIVRA